VIHEVRQYPHPIPLSSVVILFSHLLLDLPSYLFSFRGLSNRSLLYMLSAYCILPPYELLNWVIGAVRGQAQSANYRGPRLELSDQ
jgi:hypothetical protein